MTIDERIDYLTNSARWPKENLRPVTVPKAQESAEEWGHVVESLKGLKKEIDESGCLFSSLLIEDTDIDKLNYVNKCVKALYLKNEPQSGHRYVIDELYHWSDKFRISIYDFNETSETGTAVLSQFVFDQDKLCDITSGGVVIGSVYCDSSKYTSVFDTGEGLKRMPYLTKNCYNDTQNKVVSLKLDEALTTSASCKEEISELSDKVAPQLFLSNKTEAGDVTKMNYANECITTLYLSSQPEEGHRYVIFELLMWPNGDRTHTRINLLDVNESTGAETALLTNFVFDADKLCAISASNGLTGYISADSSKYHSISNQGEGGLRLPYLSDACFDLSRQSTLRMSIADSRLDSIEKNEATKRITVWGDSITWGAGSSRNDNCYANLLQTFVTNGGYPHEVWNCGIGGDNVASILVRCGGSGLYINEDITIPASSEQSVTIDTMSNWQWQKKCVKASAIPEQLINLMVQGQYGRGDWGTGEWGETRSTVNPIMVCGVPCVWTHESADSGSSGSYKLNVKETRSTPINLKAGTMIRTHGSKIHSDVFIIAAGTNGGFNGDPATYVKLIEYAIEASGARKYIVCSPFGGLCFSEVGGKAGMEALEEACAKRFGTHYLNWRTFMADEAFVIEGMTKTSSDVAAIAEGKCPPSMLADEVHPNDNGHHAIATKIYQIMQELEYL